jgi:hypothetical protein
MNEPYYDLFYVSLILLYSLMKIIIQVTTPLSEGNNDGTMYDYCY